MRLMLTVGACLIANATMPAAQADSEVQIFVRGFTLAANGAEAPAGVARGTGPLTIGQPVVGVFSHSGCGGFSVTVPPNSFSDGADVGWRVEVTPLKLVNHAVTFRLRWARAIDKAGEFEPRPGDDVEVTLKPGESRPIDAVPLQRGIKALDGRPCNLKSVSLRVSSEFPEVFDRRLIAADVWLVERLANGKEQSQRQSVRLPPHRPIPFFFDGVADGDKRLDISGHLTAELEQGRVRLALQTIVARADPGQAGYQGVKWFESKLHIQPDEIVDVALARGDEKTTWSGRVFSIRIQAKQIR